MLRVKQTDTEMIIWSYPIWIALLSLFSFAFGVFGLFIGRFQQGALLCLAAIIFLYLLEFVCVKIEKDKKVFHLQAFRCFTRRNNSFNFDDIQSVEIVQSRGRYAHRGYISLVDKAQKNYSITSMGSAKLEKLSDLIRKIRSVIIH